MNETNVIGLNNNNATPHNLVTMLTNDLDNIDAIICCVKRKDGTWHPFCSGSFSDVSFAAHLLQHRLFFEMDNR